MYKRWLVIILSLGFSSVGLSEPIWHCIANNKHGAVWNWYASTKQKAHTTVEKECALHNDHKACAIICFPPRVYWRCISHDIVPTNISTTDVKTKPGSWYWTSFSKQIAINGARDACRHNSQYGGC